MCMASAVHPGCRAGVVLLVVLFIVMAVTVLSLGYLWGSDTELACGQNMNVRTTMVYLAESGLEHAKTLLVSCQDISDEYWSGAVSQQLAAGDDYYDVAVKRDDSDPNDRCTYVVDSRSYRVRGGSSVAEYGLRGILRLDPCIAYWCGTSTSLSERVTIYGDMYCAGGLNNNSVIRGDVFLAGTGLYRVVLSRAAYSSRWLNLLFRGRK